MKSGAVFSDCRTYRYNLRREWDLDRGAVLFIGLNPSTADETVDDPTIRRCVGFARAWGYGALWMANLFAFRATDPRVMKAAAQPIGPDNDAWLKQLAAGASVVVAAWGIHGQFMARDQEVCELLGDDLRCLRVSRDGHPGHPLYLPAHLTAVPWKHPNRKP